MTSLKEISIYDHLSKTKVKNLNPKTYVLISFWRFILLGSQSDPLNLAINIEPTFIALSYSHLAVGFNNRAWFYALRNEGKPALQTHSPAECINKFPFFGWKASDPNQFTDMSKFSGVSSTVLRLLAA